MIEDGHQKVWDTSAVRSDNQFEFFADGVCSIFSDLSAERNESDLQFHARLSYWESPGTALIRIHSTGYKVKHFFGKTTESDDRDFYLNHIIVGNTDALQGEKVARVSDGNFYILDNSKPFELNMRPNKLFRTQILRLPRSAIPHAYRSRLFDLETTHDRHRLMPLLKLNLAKLAQSGGTSDLHEISYFGRTVAGLIDLMLSGDNFSGRHDKLVTHRNVILAEIDRNFLEPAFTLEQLAINLGFSSRYIQKVLAGFQLSFSEYLMDKRLERASSMLTRTPPMHSVEEAAYASGFLYLSTFYRGFRRKYGIKPGDLR